MEAKLKHLEFIQAIISRLSNASFLFKGWAVTVAGALLALAIVNSKTAVIVVAIASTLLFWGLDAYYLWLERLFIQLYASVASRPPEAIDFNMVVDKSSAFRRWVRVCLRLHLVVFYGTVLVIEIVSTVAVTGGSNGS